MTAKIQAVRVFERAYSCDITPCVGQLRFNGETLAVGPGSPPMYKHQCPVCGGIKFLQERFPSMMSLRVGEPIPLLWMETMDPGSLTDPEERAAVLAAQGPVIVA